MYQYFRVIMVLCFQALRRITIGTVVHSFSTEWRKSGLLFHEISGKIAYGLQTLKVSLEGYSNILLGLMDTAEIFYRHFAKGDSFCRQDVASLIFDNLK